MKTKTLLSTLALLALALVSTINSQLSASPLGTAFTYQGKLTSGPGAANGAYDFQFTLYDSATGVTTVSETLEVANVWVTNGVFTATLDPGPGVFTGEACWLEIGVRTNGSLAGYHTLPTRQPLVPAPQAIWAQNAGTAAVGAVSANSLNTPGHPAPGQLLSFDGTQLTWANPSSAVGAWGLTGNSGITKSNFLGTTDNQPLELRVNSQRVLRLAPAAGTPNLVGGWLSNYTAGELSGATVGGGGGTNEENWVWADFSTVSGGADNTAGAPPILLNGRGDIDDDGDADPHDAEMAQQFIDGIRIPTPEEFARADLNGNGRIDAWDVSRMRLGIPDVPDGRVPQLGGYATVSGGRHNAAWGEGSTVAGGLGNRATGYAAAIGGGQDNLAGGNFSFAAGKRAKANHPGAFVWGDSTDADFASSSQNQFLIRAGGGVGIGTNNPQSALHVNGTITANNFSGPAAGLTNVPAANLSGTVADARLSSNVALRSGGNDFSGSQTISGGMQVDANVEAIVCRSRSPGNTVAAATINASYDEYGTWFFGGPAGVFGHCQAPDWIGGYGVYGDTAADPTFMRNAGVAGLCYPNFGTLGSFTDGVYGEQVEGTNAGAGVYGYSSLTNGNGVVGEASTGSAAYAVWGKTTNASAYAGVFDGKVKVNGPLQVNGSFYVTGTKSFKMDHPLDPANQYLLHSCVESAELMNVYSGNASLDESGAAWVTLPEWFEALNRDFRYQITAIGAPAPNLHVAEEIKANRFRIAGGAPGLKVSWQVSGVRHDAWAEAHPLAVEEKKPEAERGHYLHPELYGQSAEKSVVLALKGAPVPRRAPPRPVIVSRGEQPHPVRVPLSPATPPAANQDSAR